MSSIRLFILSSFAEFGPMHGHRVRTQAQAKRMQLWTDISVGMVYGAIKRLAAEGLLQGLRRETEGNRPQRQVYQITETGRSVLAELKRATLDEIWFKFDPFDLALTLVDSAEKSQLRETISKRITRLEEMVAERYVVIADALKCITDVDEWALSHSTYRLEADLRYYTALLTWLEQ